MLLVDSSWMEKKEEPCNAVIWIKERGAGALMKDGRNEKSEEKELTKHLRGSCRDLIRQGETEARRVTY